MDYKNIGRVKKIKNLMTIRIFILLNAVVVQANYVADSPLSPCFLSRPLSIPLFDKRFELPRLLEFPNFYLCMAEYITLCGRRQPKTLEECMKFHEKECLKLVGHEVAISLCTLGCTKKMVNMNYKYGINFPRKRNLP